MICGVGKLGQNLRYLIFSTSDFLTFPHLIFGIDVIFFIPKISITRKPEHSHAPRATSTQRVRGALLLSHLAQSVSRFCTAHTQFLPFNCPLPFALCPLPSAASLMLCTLPACTLCPPPFACWPLAAGCWPLAYAPWALPVGLCLPPAPRLLLIATCPLASGRCPLAFAC